MIYETPITHAELDPGPPPAPTRLRLTDFGARIPWEDASDPAKAMAALDRERLLNSPAYMRGVVGTIEELDALEAAVAKVQPIAPGATVDDVVRAVVRSEAQRVCLGKSLEARELAAIGAIGVNTSLVCEALARRSEDPRPTPCEWAIDTRGQP